MSAVFQQNLAALEVKNPDLAHRLRALNSAQVMSEYAISEGSPIKLFRGGNLLDSTEANFLSPIPKSKLASRVIFLQGFGLGTSLAQVLRSADSNCRQIVILERDIKVFFVSLQLTDFSKAFADERLLFLVGESLDSAFSILARNFLRPPQVFHMDAFLVLEHPVLYILDKAYYDEFRFEWNDVRSFVRNQYGSLQDSLVGLSNTFKNSKRVQDTPGVLRLKSIFADKPAIICSAGPSLEKTLAEVKELQSKAIIIALDASLEACLRHGVEPHLVCTIEREMGSKVFFSKLSEFSIDYKTQLVFYPIVPPEVLNAFSGPSWVAYRDYTYFRVIESKMPRGLMASGASVAHMATKLAIYLGCSKIALVGQDLAYDPDTFESHSAGVSSEVRHQFKNLDEIKSHLAMQNQTFAMVPGNIDESVPTNSIWYSFAKEFGLLSSQTQAELVNCTGGGMRIPGLKWTSLSRFSEDWESIESPFEFLQNARKEVSVGGWDWQEVKDFLSGIGSRLQLLESEAKAASNAKEMDAPHHRKVLALLVSSKRGLEENPLFFAFVLEMNAIEHLNIENLRNSLSDQELENSVRHFELLARWFHSMAEATRQSLHTLQ